jgi:hypothetical protein
MYIYIDESGNFGWPLKAGSEPYMLFSVLVIDDLKSKQAIAQAVSRAIVDLRKHHQSCKSDPSKRIEEFKGSGELCDRPDVRLRFFKRIVKKANFHIYAVILDKRALYQKLPENYMERYSMLMMNILYAIPIPRNQKWVTMVVDSQAVADPTQPLKVRYPSKAKRLRQKRARARDKNRRNQYTQMITSVFKRFLKSRGTHLRVWHVRSHDDRCLQAVDVIGHFMYQRLKLDEERKNLYKSLPPYERSPKQLEKNSQWQKIKEERNKWFEDREVLKPRIEFVRKPNYLVRQGVKKLARYSRQFRKAVSRGNREA